MATVPLPERPNLDQLRKRARELQRAGLRGDPDALRLLRLEAADPALALTTAQRALARRHGFASWARLKQHVEQIEARTWSSADPLADEPIAHRFVRLACLIWDGDPSTDTAAARALLTRTPDLPQADVAVAAVAADPVAVQSHLRNGIDVNNGCGPFGWSPLMYLTYSRFPTGEAETLRTARVLLDAGADPNDGRYFGGCPTPFTVLTGVFGDGEGDQPRHRWAVPLARELLEAGADANDGQTLYNRQFDTSDDFLEVLFEWGLGQGDGGPWRARLPDLTQSPVDLVRILLDWAVTHDQRERVALLAAHGVDIVSPLPAGRTRTARTPLEVALANGHSDLADQLRALGAPEPEIDPVDAFIGAALAGDATISTAPAEVVAAARAARPGLVVWAAAQGGTAAVRLLLDAGFDIDALARGDVPIEQAWQTALHTAVERNNAAMVSFLLDRGADTSIRDARSDSTPLDWATHFDLPAIADLLTGPDTS